MIGFRWNLWDKFINILTRGEYWELKNRNVIMSHDITSMLVRYRNLRTNVNMISTVVRSKDRALWIMLHGCGLFSHMRFYPQERQLRGYEVDLSMDNEGVKLERRYKLDNRYIF